MFNSILTTFYCRKVGKYLPSIHISYSLEINSARYIRPDNETLFRILKISILLVRFSIDFLFFHFLFVVVFFLLFWLFGRGEHFVRKVKKKPIYDLDLLRNVTAYDPKRGKRKKKKYR